jgi:hypothetical protein
MDSTSEKGTGKGTEILEPKSLAIAAKGIDTGVQFARFMSALMTDLIEGRVSPGIGNAACNAGGKLLKVVELQHKYGTPGPGRGCKVLDLTMNGEELEQIAGTGKLT